MGRSCKTRGMTDQELRDFWAVFDLRDKIDWYYYHVFRLQYLTALRISDMLQLTKSEVKNKHFNIQELKTRKIREVYLCDEAFVLANQLAELTDYYLLTARDSSTYRRSVKKYAGRAGIDTDRISTHSMRKSIANKIALIKGLKVASKLLNHSKLDTTEKYLDDSYKSIKEGIDIISRSS